MTGALRVSVIITGLSKHNFEPDHAANTKQPLRVKPRPIASPAEQRRRAGSGAAGEESAAGSGGLMAFFRSHW